MSTGIDKADLIRALAGLSDDERRALFGAVQAAPQSQTPKLSEALDQVPDDQVAAVVNAARRGITQAADNPAADADCLSELREVSPVLAAACQRNSMYRRKPFVHSLVQVVNHLQSEVWAAKCAARARRVPVKPKPKPPDEKKTDGQQQSGKAG